MEQQKYRRYESLKLKNRKWPDNIIEKAPIWCSVDLRDGNQALPVPMSVEQKVELFKLLVEIGFKEIEIGFPSASDTEYNFLRRLIDEDLIPKDVTVQVLTQAREHLIRKTFESLKGCKKAVIHFYNSTSTIQRNVVFNKDKKEIVEIAVNGAKLIKTLEKDYPNTEFTYEYSPESFTGTEMDYALEICEAVIDIFQPDKNNKLILNLPATVEMSTPNIYADQIEWFAKNIKNRESIIISLHTHNDRGTGIAASELGLLAGADRIEGTLFGNGERTGNVDIIALAMNMFSQGIDSKLNFKNMKKVVETYEKCTKLDVHPRTPYSGELVYTAFSGSHQDAIRKGLLALKESGNKYWEVPYLPIDPADVGREYEAIIRINSQSGKGGVAFIMEQNYGIKLPKIMHPEFGALIQKVTDEKGSELKANIIYEIFEKEYLNFKGKYKLKSYSIKDNVNDSKLQINAFIETDDKDFEIEGRGNGPIAAFCDGIKKAGLGEFQLKSYDEHALSQGADSSAIAYIQVEFNDGEKVFGVGKDANINTASLNALISAINRK